MAILLECVARFLDHGGWNLGVFGAHDEKDRAFVLRVERLFIQGAGHPATGADGCRDEFAALCRNEVRHRAALGNAQNINSLAIGVVIPDHFIDRGFEEMEVGVDVGGVLFRDAGRPVEQAALEVDE